MHGTLRSQWLACLTDSSQPCYSRELSTFQDDVGLKLGQQGLSYGVGQLVHWRRLHARIKSAQEGLLSSSLMQWTAWQSMLRTSLKPCRKGIACTVLGLSMCQPCSCFVEYCCLTVWSVMSTPSTLSSRLCQYSTQAWLLIWLHCKVVQERQRSMGSVNLHNIKFFTRCSAYLFQDYCKDWAEQMIVSVVLVCSEPLALHMLHSKQPSSQASSPPWSADNLL